MIGKFVGVLFLARDLAHRQHLLVTGPGSDAKHRALASFYEGVIEAADELAEVCIIRFGEFEVPLLDNPYPNDPVGAVEAQLKWIEENRYKAVPQDDTPIQNLIDSLVIHYLRSLYKLKRLQ